MSIRLRKMGDWVKAGVVIQNLQAKIFPAYSAQLSADGDLILKTLQQHIQAQDLNWSPLAERTIALKGGDSTIYVETGYLYSNLEVRKVRSNETGMTFFIGASAWKTHTPSGEKFSDLMIWLEYGTDRMPPRPLIRPTWEEIKPILEDNWTQVLGDLIVRT